MLGVLASVLRSPPRWATPACLVAPALIGFIAEHISFAVDFTCLPLLFIVVLALSHHAFMPGLQPRLRDVGIGEEHLAGMARHAMKQTQLLLNNPREVTEADALSIYKAAW
ncbi:hypothetical protein [Sinorhizobium fredii]|uniref:Alcohol dehydrogenase iron-type domain-containing protein n=1 Tax=Rhizobium fredii TaxID=380 RepID=A0A2L0HD34_RHIFR|nr:alcohol dehydrogenase iron-type domain-containing protein [Sinorhizobium fredii]